jgi:hypothetical protein
MSEEDPGELSELSRRLLLRAREGDPPAEALAGLRRSVLSAIVTGGGGGSGGGPAAHPASVAPHRAMRAPLVVGSALTLAIVGASVWVARGSIPGGSERGAAPSEPGAGAVALDPRREDPAITPRAAIVDPPEVVVEAAPMPGSSREATADRDDEGGYVESIRRAVDRDPSRALRMSRRHAALFPRGLLGEEVAALEVESLARAGRHDDARALAEAFFGRHPESAYRRRIDRALAAIGERE